MLVSYSTLLTYYVIGSPLDLYFAEPWGLDLKIIGIWIGFGACNIMILVQFAFVLARSSFHVQAEEINERVEK